MATTDADKDVPLIGRVINNYEIKSVVAEGGMGTVYLAEHPFMGRRAAIKVLRGIYLEDRDMITRFLNEARAANAIHHPNIVEIIDVGRLPQDGPPYLMMEFLEGETLKARLSRLGRLPAAEAARIIDQAAAALEAAHAAGIVHRDLKPDNLFLVPDTDLLGGERVKVVDFGIAKLEPTSFGKSTMTTGIVLGTPHYMSPEQCRGSGIDLRSDIYALGAILYEMLTGKTPFVGETPVDVMMMHVVQIPTAPRELFPEIPEHLDRVVLRALAKKPDERFATMAELRAALIAPPPGAKPSSRSLPTVDHVMDQSIRDYLVTQKPAQTAPVTGFWRRPGPWVGLTLGLGIGVAVAVIGSSHLLGGDQRAGTGTMPVTAPLTVPVPVREAAPAPAATPTAAPAVAPLTPPHPVAASAPPSARAAPAPAHKKRASRGGGAICGNLGTNACSACIAKSCCTEYQECSASAGCKQALTKYNGCMLRPNRDAVACSEQFGTDASREARKLAGCAFVRVTGPVVTPGRCLEKCEHGAITDDACAAYCSCMDRSCRATMDPSACLSICARLKPEQISCRTYHCFLGSRSDPDIHCQHAVGGLNTCE